MHLSHLSLHNFRNFVRLELDLLPGVTLLLGDNAQGKTNLLEAIYYLATSRSPHAGADRELVNWLAADREPLPYARLVGRVARGGQEPQPTGTRDLLIEITLAQRENNRSLYRKQIRLNGVIKRAMDLLGHLNAVLFLPEDIDLVPGPPSLRRRYLDAMLCQIDPAYCRTLAHYNEVIAQRNALLRDLRERGGDPGQLVFWDERLVEHGAQIVVRRREALISLDELAKAIHDDLTDGAEQLHLSYTPSMQAGAQEPVATVSAAFQAQLQALHQREIAAGVTLAGPHRDEFRFVIDGIDAGVYGSRGQQRTAALAAKLAEADLMRHETGEYPLLLLDDVFSELDAQRRRFLLRWLTPLGLSQQAVITTTDLHVVPQSLLDRCQLWRVQSGRLSPIAGATSATQAPAHPELRQEEENRGTSA